jgi:hypothetical protein
LTFVDLPFRVCARSVVLNGWSGDLPVSKALIRRGFCGTGRRAGQGRVERGDDLPGLRLRICKARKPSGIGAHRSKDYVDIAVDESVDNSLPSKPQQMSTFETTNASYQSGSLPGHLSMPETRDSFLISKDDPTLVPIAAVS